MSNTQSVAIVPVRDGSQRIKNKNFIEFVNGMSLLDLKIIQLKESKTFDQIFISSDSMRAKEVAEKHDVGFIRREKYLCSSEVRWSDVISGVAETIPLNDPIIAWTHATSPLYSNFEEPLDVFKENYQAGTSDSLVAVSKFQDFIINEYGRPLNYHWGVWHDYSQDLAKQFRVTGALFIARKKDIIKWRYLIGVRPYLFEVDQRSSVDVDLPEDFRLAQLLYGEK